ncbi:MFS transporter [Novosphingobium ovatum]|uniref:MFS transporter n=1 Tax=Novosphingobium ovatum TaxID=1908523 RepID=UPI001D105DCD|nr:MFS transporter [Novosphingobium ovatum]
MRHPPQAPAAHGLLHALTTTTLVQIIATATALALPPIAPRAAADLGIAAHYVGYQISLIYLVGAIGSAMSGTLLARFGAVLIEVVSLALFALGLLLLSAARLDLAVLASVAVGMGYGLQNPASSHILNHVCPPARRGIVFSIKQAGVPLGAVASSLSLPVMDQIIGWRMTVALMAIAPVLLIAHLLWHHRHDHHHARPGAGFIANFIAEQQLVWRSGRLRVLSALGLLYSAVQLSLSAFLVLMLVENHGWSLVSAAAVGGLLQAFGAVGRVTWGWLADRIGSGIGILSFIGVASTLGLVACLWLSAMPMAGQIALLCALGFCLSGWNGVAMAEIARSAPPQDTGRVMGGALVYTFIGVMLGPSSYALIYEGLGRYDATFVAVSSALVLGALASGWLALHQRRAA